MTPQIKDLIDISAYYGTNKDYVIAGGGNTSYKDKKTIWINASGKSLADLTEVGNVSLVWDLLRGISLKHYSEDPVTREDQVKTDLLW
jgi:rhamnose utilization protein RhaD (predicted bifunctional aldolase and dehydrogenase)